VIAEYIKNNKVNKKGYRNNPLTEDQNASNCKKPITRTREEYVFGFIKQSMKGLIVNSVRIIRATGIIVLIIKPIIYSFASK